MTVHVGTIGWSYSFWKPNFYPQKLASKDFLSYYSNKIDTVEVDNSFYRIPTAKAVTDWKNQTPEGFVFSFKFPQVITHVKLLKDCEQETRVFLERVGLMVKSWGFCFCSFHPFSVNNTFRCLRLTSKLCPKTAATRWKSATRAY